MSGLQECANQARILLQELDVLQTGYQQLLAVTDREDAEQVVIERDVPLRVLLPDLPETPDEARVRIRLDYNACVEATTATAKRIAEKWRELQTVVTNAANSTAATVHAYETEDVPPGSQSPPPQGDGNPPQG